MENQTTLKAQKRDGTGKGVARKLRQDGKVPAVLYGRDLEAMHLSVEAHDAELLFHSISVDNTIVELDVEGEKESFQTLVREIQSHPFKAHLLHIDFLRIQKGVKVDVEIPVNLVGVPKGVKLSGGILDQIIYDLPMSCIPSKIPETIEVDVSDLDIGDSIHISDLTFDEGLEILIDPERTICNVGAPRVVESDDEEEEEGLDAPAADAAADADADGGSDGDSEG